MTKVNFNLRSFKGIAIAICLAATTMFSGCDKDDPMNNGADIVAFTFTGINGTATIDKDALTVTATANETVDLTAIVATFTLSNGATATVNGTAQVSGTTANNFSNTVIYNVTSSDSRLTNIWKVTIKKNNSSYTFPWLDATYGSWWQFGNDTRTVWVYLKPQQGSDWTVVFDDEGFAEKTKEDEDDLGGFPAYFSGGFTVTVDGRAGSIYAISVNNGDIFIRLSVPLDADPATENSIVKVKYDKPAEEKWHIPYGVGYNSPVQGVVQSFGFTAPIRYWESLMYHNLIF
jgi:predicted 3-demethylubiquinone-9 3-methyltransferase (glyoxalase superfamily)